MLVLPRAVALSIVNLIEGELFSYIWLWRPTILRKVLPLWDNLLPLSII